MRRKRYFAAILALCLAAALLSADVLALDIEEAPPTEPAQETAEPTEPPEPEADGGDETEAAPEESAGPPEEGTGLFQDVNDPEKYYYDAIAWAVDTGVVSEDGTGYFGVGKPCTRSDVVLFLWRMRGRPAAETSAEFPDVTGLNDPEAYQAISWATARGLIKGFEDGTFRPMATISRKDVLLMLFREAGSPAASGELSFPDVIALGESIYTETGKAILWGTNIHVTNGFPSGNFHPLENCSREQIITFLYRYEKTLHTGYATGAYEVDGRLEYYENGVFRPYTGLVERVSDGKSVYVEDGIFKEYTGVALRCLDQRWYYVLNGELTEDRSVMQLSYEDRAAGKTEMFVYAWARALFYEITTPEMSREEKLRACFYYMASADNWTHIRKRVPHVQGNGWNLVYAMDMIEDGGSVCHGFSSIFGLLVKLCGYDPYWCYNRNYHSWVEIDGLVYDPFCLEISVMKTLIYGYTYEQVSWAGYYDTSIHEETWRHFPVPSF